MSQNETTQALVPSTNPWSSVAKPRRVEDLPELADRKELALFLGVSVPTLARWAMTGEGPRVTRIGAHVRYRRAHVIEYLDASAA